MQVQQTWASILNAPVELEDVLIAEWLWAATKSMFSGLAIIAVMLALNISRSPTLLLLLPVIMLTGLALGESACVSTRWPAAMISSPTTSRW